MAKFSYKSKLSIKEQEELLMDLCDAISSIKDSKEAAQFMKDLLSPQEAEMLSKRIKIAELLLQNWNYKDIKDLLRVSDGTISRVSEWLKFTGDGYRMIVKRLKKQRTRRPQSKHRRYTDEGMVGFKNKYSSMFWPELLIDNLIEYSKTKDKNKILGNMRKMRLKPALYRKIEKEITEF